MPTTRRKSLPDLPSLTIRLAVPEDEAALEELAQLDSSHAPRGVVLVAEVDGALWAALSLDDNHGVSDPLHPTAELLFLLMERGRRLKRAERGRLAGRTRVWPRGLDPRPVG